MVERVLLSGSIAAALAKHNEATELPLNRGSEPGWKIAGGFIHILTVRLPGRFLGFGRCIKWMQI